MRYPNQGQEAPASPLRAARGCPLSFRSRWGIYRSGAARAGCRRGVRDGSWGGGTGIRAICAQFTRNTRNTRCIRNLHHEFPVRAFCGLDDSTYREDLPVPTRTSTPLLTNTVRSYSAVLVEIDTRSWYSRLEMLPCFRRCVIAMICRSFSPCCTK